MLLVLKRLVVSGEEALLVMMVGSYSELEMFELDNLIFRLAIGHCLICQEMTKVFAHIIGMLVRDEEMFTVDRRYEVALFR